VVDSVTMSVQISTNPEVDGPVSPHRYGYAVLVFPRPGDPGRLARSFADLADAMEWAGAHWYEADRDRPYDLWVRCETTGRLYFAPRLRIRLEKGANGRDAEAARWREMLARPPAP